MSKSFNEISQGIANDFLQNIVFIDDNAYTDKKGNAHDFDALAITKEFSLSEKFCAVYRPEIEDDIEKYTNVAKKADVTILDWEINLQTPISAEEKDDNDDDDDESDVTEIDTRGVYTKPIIKKIIADPVTGKDSLKLILVYTGSTDLPKITDEIKQFLEAGDFISLKTERDNNNCCLSTKNIRIQVIYKGDAANPKFTHIPELKQQEISYEELPQFVLSEFTKLTSGLLSNFALKALTTIRRNSHQLLSLFSKELDSAYLAHRSILPNVFDSEEFITILFKDILYDLLRHKNISETLAMQNIDLWLEDNIEEKIEPVLSKKGNPINKETYTLNKDVLSSILGSTEPKKERFETAFGSKGSVSGDHVNSVSKLYIQDSIKLFNSSESYNMDFALLTHNKTFIDPVLKAPILTLGTIVSQDGNYYVCIQQRCDSVRIIEGEERRFNFIPLEVVTGNGKFNLISPDKTKLKLKTKSYDLRTIKFTGTYDGVISKIEKDSGNGNQKFVFNSVYEGGKFQWICELKDLHAQRIVTEYCSNLSKVGLDESEWLRLNQ